MSVRRIAHWPGESFLFGFLAASFMPTGWSQAEDTAHPVQFSFHADRIELPGGGAFTGVTLQGQVAGDESLRWEIAKATAAGIEGSAHVVTGERGVHAVLAAHTTDVTALNGLLENERVAGAVDAFTGGSLALTAVLDFEPDRTAIETRVEVRDFGLSGVNVAEALDLGVDAKATRRGDAWDFDLAVRHTAGTFYVEPGLMLRGMRPGFVIEAGEEPLTLDAAGSWAPASRELALGRFQYRHPRVVNVDARGTLRIAMSAPVSALHATIDVSDLQRVYEVYAQPLAFGTMFKALEASGGVTMEFTLDDGGLADFIAKLTDVYLDDRDKRFGLYGLQGTIAVHPEDFELESGVSWEGISFYQIDVGAGAIRFLSQNRDLQVYSWEDMRIFDGLFTVDRLELAALGTADMRIDVAGRLSPVSLAIVTDALDWPILQGTISGVIPKLSYFHNQVTLDGTLDIRAFDGAITISEFRIDEFFSTVPRLYADVALDGLDLALLTSALSFGRIQGHLGGYVRDLRMESWEPVSFDALVRTPKDDDVRHRIDRKAVDNLGRLGAGASGALSSGWLRFVPDYSYGQLGIACRLRNGYCELSGVADAGGGDFYVLTRGGLLPPWIDIKGSGRMVEWDTLLAGIREISRREMVVDVGGAR